MFNVFSCRLPQHFIPVVQFDTECICASLVLMLFQEKYHKDFSFRLFL